MTRHFLLTVCFVATFIFGWGFSVSEAQESGSQKVIRTQKILFFTRSDSDGHSPARMREDGTTISGAALKKYGEGRYIAVYESHDGRVFDGDIDQYDSFVFYTTGSLQKPNQKNIETMQPVSDEGLNKFIAAVREKGKGFVGIHSATDTHSLVRDKNNKDPYVALIGGRFCGHGPSQFVTPIVTKPIQFPWLQEINGKLTAHDEWYAMTEFNKEMHVVLVMDTQAEGLDGYNDNHYGRPPFPVCWIRQDGKGRVAYVFGHDDRYWWNSENVRRVGEFVEWSLGRFDLDTTPNFDQVTPGAFEMPKKKN